MLVTTEAIVLRSRKQGETSKIVTLYTLGFGKLNVIAKGARETKSKFGASLEMFAKSNVVFYKKDKHDSLSLLSKAETLDSHSAILKRLETIEAATEIIELVLHAMHDEEANEELYRLLDLSLDQLTATPSDRNGEHIIRTIQIRFYLGFAAIMGFAIELDTVSAELATVFRAIESESSKDLKLSEREYERISGFFDSYFTEHLPGVTRRSMKSAKVFSSL